MKLDGKQQASELLARLKLRVDKLKQKGITPTLAVVLIGNDENSLMYIKQKKIKAEEIGAQTIVNTFDPNVSKEEIESTVRQLNNDLNIHGLILQRPAPSQLGINEIEELISPKKEVDGFGSQSTYPVPVAEAVYRLINLALNGEDLTNKKVAVLGKGETAGMPIIHYLRKKGVEPTIIDSKTENKEEIISNSDIVISAVGKENILDPGTMKKGAILIGVGLHTNSEGKLRGDFDDRKAEEAGVYYTPTPGGVGPLNVTCLMENLVNAAYE